MRLAPGSRLRAVKALAVVVLACELAAVVSPAQKRRRNKEEEQNTQTLELPRELPAAVAGDTHRLSFYVTPLSSKGLLSQQVRDALKALSRQASGPVLKIRAFVAGTGDVRRVRDLISETYSNRKQPLPALSLVQAGALPLEGAQVVLEAVSAGKKEVNPGGLGFFSAPVATSENPLDPPAPLAAKSLAGLGKAVDAAGVEPSGVLRVTCFLSSFENLAATRTLVGTRYPRAALNFLQPRRVPERALGACEAVARLRAAPGVPVRFLNDGEARDSGESQAALIGAPTLVFTGTQASFGYQEQDARLAFGRLEKALQQAGSSGRNVAFAHYYPLSYGIADQVRKVRSQFFDPANPPAGQMLLFEGLPSMDAGFAVEVVAVKR